MWESLLLSAALLIGQSEGPVAEPGAITTTVIGEQPAPAAPVPPVHRPVEPWNQGAACCDSGCCKSGLFDCPVVWLRPWKCEDLEMKPFEHKQGYCGLHGLLWCPKEEKKENGNGDKKNGDKKNGDEAKKNGAEAEAKKNGEAAKEEEKKNGEEEKKEEEPKTLTPLMQLIKCASQCKYDRMEKKGDNFYGWVQQGFTANFDSPQDRINFGNNFNWRSNDYRLNQVYFVYENPLEHEDKANVGYRVDFYTGHTPPFMTSLGLFSDFTGFDATSGYGVAGPASFRQLNRIGIDLPQFWLEAHIPFCITEKGIDVRVGKFWTLIGHEVYPAPLTYFYSHSYEIVYATPFNHTGILSTLHATDTWDVTAGIVRGQDVFEDNNNRPSYTGAFIWNSCDKRLNWTTAWITGPEQLNNNDNYRTVASSYLTATFGSCSQWKFVTGGHMAWEANAVADPATGGLNDAEWYGLSNYLFYTVDPSLILGTRFEWFRDDDGVRTAVTKRPGFSANFYEWTLGVTYKTHQNLRFRPELRFDWSDGPAVDGTAARPYNDLRDKFQTTAAIDVIWEF